MSRAQVQINELNSICFQVKANKLDRPVLTTLPNPDIKNLKKKYKYLQGLDFSNEDDDHKHPVHIILGAGEITRIRTPGFVSGGSGQPVAENTLYGWYVMGGGSGKK